MKTIKTGIIIAILFLSSAAYAGETPSAVLAKGSAIEQGSALLEGYCGRETLREALVNLKIETAESQAALAGLTLQADTRKGYNTLLEIKQAAEQAGLQAEGVRYTGKTAGLTERGMQSLRLLKETAELIVNITGNRHFALVQEVHDNGVRLYIPGLNYSEPQLSWEEFARTWDGVALVVSPSSLRGVLSPRAGRRSNLILVSDVELSNIYGGQPCGNVNGGGGNYSGSGGNGRYSAGNGAGPSDAESAKAPQPATTIEPVVINNGNLFLTVQDISVPTRSLPLKLKRYYNAEIVSEVNGWLPEPGAGSWAIENGEYSGQGNRSTSEQKFQDFSLELDMQTIEPGGNHSWETAWVNIRYTEDPSDPRKARDCYYFLIHTDGKIELAKWKNGGQYFLYQKSTAYRPTNKNHIKIAAAGANIKVYINGALEIDYTDSDPMLSAGRIALESYFSHSHFDNVTVNAGSQNYSYNFNSDDNEFIFGYGWTHSYQLRIKEYANHVTLYRENNARETYVPNGNGTYFSVPVSYYSKLTKDTNGFSLKDKYGLHYRFNLSGQLQYIQDRNGNNTTLSYTTIGGKSLLSAITEPVGRKITLTYGANNLVSTAADPAGNQVQYYYDNSGHLTQVRDRNGNSTNYTYSPITHNLVELSDPEGNEYSYSYIYNDRVNTQTDPLGNTTKFDYLWTTVHVINQRNEIYKYNFDTRGFLQSITDPDGRIEYSANDANGNITTYCDKDGNTTTYSYDVQGNRTAVCDAAGNRTKFTYDGTYNLPMSITDAKSNITTLTYDSKGNLIKTVNAEGGVTTFTYNTYGQVVSSKDPQGNLTQYIYDSYGNLAGIQDALNNQTSYSYDILSRLRYDRDAFGNAKEYIYDDNGNLLTAKDPLGNATSYTYDGLDKISTVTGPLGNTVSYSYDCFGNLLSVNDALGNNTSYSYDTTNQMHLNHANLLSISDANGNITRYTYDSLDRLSQESDAQGQTCQYNYDAQGNLCIREDACGQETGYRYDSLNRLVKIVWPDYSETNYTYDALSCLTRMQDAGGTTTYTYDKLKRLKSQVYPDGTALNYSYDLNGNRTILEVSGAGKINYTYDPLNRLTKITQPDGKLSQFSYDRLSRRTQLNYPNGAVTTYGYDQASRLTQLINKDKSAQEMSKYLYTYNAAGDRTKVTAHNGTVTYAYDKNRQLIQELSSLEGTSILNEDSYDGAGNRLIRKTSSVPENYSYNNLNQLISQTSGATTTATEKYIQVKGSVGDANLQSVKVNGVNAQVSGGQFTADNILLNPGQNTITAEAVDAAGNTGSHQIKVTYQPGSSAQKIITVQGNVSDASPVTMKVNGITATVSAGQWTANNVPLNPGQNTIVAEATDAAGNKSSKQIKVTYNVPQTTDAIYTYDKNGNLSQKNTRQIAKFSYDFENRLKNYSDFAYSASYTYDGLGRRISKRVSGTTTKYYYDGDELILEKTGTAVIYYIHGPRIDEIISDSRGYCYHTDGLGSVVNLSDSTGTKAAGYDYTAYGEQRSQSGSVSNCWGWTGRQYDNESGLYYYRNRYYDPSDGRFITRDPSLTLSPRMPYLLPAQLNSPLELHRYLYCANNPVNLVDPFGLEPGETLPEWALIIGGITIVSPIPGDELLFWTGVAAAGAYGVYEFSSHNKKGPLWDAPGMPGDRLRQYEQSQPGSFTPPPNFKKDELWKKIIWAIGKIAEVFYRD